MQSDSCIGRLSGHSVQLIGQFDSALCRMQRRSPSLVLATGTLFSGRALSFLNSTSLSSVSPILMCHLAVAPAAPRGLR